MNLQNSFFIFALALMLLLISCTKENEENLNGIDDTETTVDACETIYSFANDVVPTLATEGSCYNCHSAATAFGGINMEGYDNFMLHLDAIHGSSNRFPQYSPMPKGGDKMSDEALDILDCWIEQGAENN